MRASNAYLLLLLVLGGCGNQTMAPIAPTCGSAARTGQTDCSGVTTCNAGQYCDDSGFPTCTPGCTSDANCGPNEFCARLAGEPIGACQSCPVCGNGACEPGENNASCASDCTAGPVCGDGACATAEMASCPADCGAQAVCGNAVCETGETAPSCASDCGGPTCGSASRTGLTDCSFTTCNPGQYCDDAAVPATCVPGCTSDANCGPNEFCARAAGQAIGACQSCPFCGNGLCEGGESGGTCASDCVPAVCGNRACEATETASTCPGDCGSASCGDGFCDASESAASCATDCPDDTLSECYVTCDSYDFYGCFEPGGLQWCRDSCAAATMAQRQQYLGCAITGATFCEASCFSFLP